MIITMAYHNLKMGVWTQASTSNRCSNVHFASEYIYNSGELVTTTTVFQWPLSFMKLQLGVKKKSINDFTENLRRNLYFKTENRVSRNEIWCVVVNHNYTCHICAKGFGDSNLNKAVIDKISILHEIAPNITYKNPSPQFTLMFGNS